MGYYFRKSIGKGPFRMNFSKSGVSYSFGVKGARVNMSSRGTYVTFGSNGIYYRRKISGTGQKSNSTVPKSYAPATYTKHTITSGNIENITDTDSQDFINELTEKEKKIHYFNCFGIFPLIVCFSILSFVFFSNRTQSVEKPPETKYFVTASSNINIRQSPVKSSQILGVLNAGDQAALIDEALPEWFKVNFNGQEGFISKKFSEKIPVQVEQQVVTTNFTLLEKKPLLFGIWFVALILFFSLLLSYLKKVDNKRLLVEIYYNMDDSIKDVYEKFEHNFAEILKCQKVWQYLHSERTFNYKYSSGAGYNVTRKPLNNISTNNTPSKIFKTNIQIPYIGLINTELFFFPERLIIKRGKQFGAIMYKNMDCTSRITQFIESEGVPSDAVIVGHTWRFLNKDGSPDRRFNNNHRLPICQYSEYSFNSTSGLNERICTSKVGGFNEFFRYMQAIGLLQKNMSANGQKPSDENKNMLS